MSEPLIDQLAAAAGALRAAMQSADAPAIEQAVAQFRAAVDAVKSVDDWQSNAALKTQLADLLNDLDASHRIARLLGDRAGQAQDALASHNPDAPQPLYKPSK